LIDNTTALIAIGGLLIFKLLDRAFDFFWKRGPGTDYVTVVACTQRQAQCKGNTDTPTIKRAVMILIQYSDKVPQREKDIILKGMID